MSESREKHTDMSVEEYERWRLNLEARRDKERHTEKYIAEYRAYLAAEPLILKQFRLAQ